MDASFVFFICIIIFIYVLVVDRRRRRDAEALKETIAALTSRLYGIEQQAKSLEAITARLFAVEQQAKPPEQSAPPAAHTEPKPVPAPPPKPVPLPAIGSVPSAQPPYGIIPVSPGPSAVREVPGIPLTLPQPVSKPATPPSILSKATRTVIPAQPVSTPATPPSVPVKPSVSPASPAPAQPVTASASYPSQPAMPGMTRPPQPPLRPPAQTEVLFGAASLTKAPVKKKKNISLEEVVGTNWLPKLGITAMVVGVALLVASQWGRIGLWGRVSLLYIGALGLLAGGIFLERKERYLTLGRSLIGGGWAITFLVSFAIGHFDPVLVLPSQTADLFLLLLVAGAMVWHTLKYNSQLVTGIAFLLGFVSVTVSMSSGAKIPAPFHLVAGAILVAGLTVIVLRRKWFELEVFGILASYLNHAYWLYPIINPMAHKGPFPEYQASVALMVAYWIIFRASYLVRKVDGPEQESVSTVAGLLNPLLFMGVMKYQSFHPEWAFYALMVMGAVEFALGQLPVARKRRTPFQILSSLGATLMIVAVPCKYAGNTLELFWMAGAEVFLLAGIFTREKLFRWFGGIISFLVAGYRFVWPPNGVLYLAGKIVNGEAHFNPTLSIVLGVIAIMFYVNSHVLGRIWRELFDEAAEEQALTALSFIASVFAAAAIYCYVPDNALGVSLALLFTALCWTGQQFRISEMVYQAHWIAVVAMADVSIRGLTLNAAWHSIPQRIIAFGLVAGLLYLSSRFVRLAESSGRELMVVLYRWAGTAMIALLVWLQMPPRYWLIAVLWTALGLALCAVAHLLKRNEFRWQAFVLALMSFFSAFVFNFEVAGDFHHVSYRLISVTLVAGGIYLLTRFAPVVQIRPAYSWVGTILLAFLAYRETYEQYQQWTGVAWIALAFVLGWAARYWEDLALLWQTHLLSLAATGWIIYVNFDPASPYRGKLIQIITVLITAGLLYALTWITNIAAIIGDERISQAYSWAGSTLVCWLAWLYFKPINVSLMWAVFGLVLFEIGYNKTSAYLRAQSYVALVSSFVHVFYSNFNSIPGGEFLKVITDPAFITAVLLVPIYFWVYVRLHALNSGSGGKILTKAAASS